MSLSDIWDIVYGWLSTTGLRLALALAVLLISFRLVDRIGRKIEKFIGSESMARAEKKQRELQMKRNAASGAERSELINKTIYKTVSYTFRISVKILILVGLVNYVGVDTSAVTTLVASLGVGVGLAVNGALANFAGGVLLVITRPFSVDDYISAGGYEGTVEDIHICYTRLVTPDNKVIFLPNGTLATETVVNYSVKDTRRVDLLFSIAYGADFSVAKGVVEDIFAAHPLVLKDPPVTVRMKTHNQSSIDMTARCWVKKENYWTVYFDVTEQVKKAFDEKGIEIPFNQLDVHIKS